MSDQSRYYGRRGPYGTESEVIAAIGMYGLPLAECEQFNADRLAEAIAAAGVEVGPYDRHVLRELTTDEPTTVEVIASLIERAAHSRDGA